MGNRKKIDRITPPSGYQGDLSERERGDRGVAPSSTTGLGPKGSPMLFSARTRRLGVALSSSLLAAVALVAVPAAAGADVADVRVSAVPVALPGVPAIAPAPDRRRLRLPRRRRAPGRASSATLRRALLCLVNGTRATAGLSRLPRRAPPRPRREPPRRRHGPPRLLRPRLAQRSQPARPRPRRRLARRRRRGHRLGLRRPRDARARRCSAWLASPPHRAIILGGGRAAGIGVKRLAGCGGRAYWVIDVG